VYSLQDERHCVTDIDAMNGSYALEALDSERRWMKRSELVDCSLAVLVGWVLPLVLDRYIPPRVTAVALEDPSIQLPKRAELVPAPLLLLFAYVAPVGMLWWQQQQQQQQRLRESFGNGFRSKGGTLLDLLTGVIEANGLTLLATVVLKLLIGKPRPYFAQVCGQYLDPVQRHECAGDPWQVREARKSFPSGHAALAFSGVMHWQCCIWYLGIPLPWFEALPSVTMVHLLLRLLPWTGATLVAASRVLDHHHDVVDVLGGAVLGCALSHLVTTKRFLRLEGRVPGHQSTASTAGARRTASASEMEAIQVSETTSIPDAVV